MKHNKIVATVILLLTVGIVAGMVILGVRLFSGTDFSPVFETEGRYSYNGFLFLPEKEGGDALYYRLQAKEGSNDPARTFVRSPLKTVDLKDFGFEGVFSYYVENGFAVPVDPAYEGFWPATDETRLIYLNGAEKWRLDTEQKKAYPMFSDSIDGVDPYGKDVLAFSAGAYFAVGFDGKTATVYVSDDDPGSLKVTEKKTVDLSPYGKNLVFHAFVNGRDCFFSGEKDGKKCFFALNCQEMTVAVSSLPDAEYTRLLGRVYLLEKEEKTEKKTVFTWVNCLLGTEFSASLPREEYRSGEIQSVSPLGNYAVAVTVKETGEKAFTVMNRKKACDLTPGEGETVEEVSFAYDNILLATIRRADGSVVSRGYKICF